MCKTTLRFVECPKHGTTTGTERNRCAICVNDADPLRVAAQAAEAAFFARADRQPGAMFPERKVWPEWAAMDAARDAYNAATPYLKPRVVKHERKPENTRETCGSACLNGKRACSCVCAGFCHGAGECRCQTPEGKAHRDALWAQVYATKADA